MKKSIYNLSLKLHSEKSFVRNVSTQEIEIIEKNNHNFFFIFPKTTYFTGNLNFDVLAHSRRYGGLKVKNEPCQLFTYTTEECSYQWSPRRALSIELVVLLHKTNDKLVISRTFKGNEIRFELKGVRSIAGKANFIRGEPTACFCAKYCIHIMYSEKVHCTA